MRIVVALQQPSAAHKVRVGAKTGASILRPLTLEKTNENSVMRNVESVYLLPPDQSLQGLLREAQGCTRSYCQGVRE
jgi:hypothetical protein